MSGEKLRRLYTVNRFLQQDVSKEKELQQIVELAAKICNSPIAMLTFMDNKTQYVKFRVGTDLQEVPYQDTFCRHTIQQNKLVVIPDTATDERVFNNRFVVQAPHVRFYAGSPLTTHDELNLGTLCVYDFAPKSLTPVQEKMLNQLSRQAIQLLELDASLRLLKEQYELAMEEETKLRSFFEGSSSCHLLLDKELRILAFNQALADVMATLYRTSVTEGVKISEHLHPAFVNEFILNCERALTGERIATETVIVTPGGEIPTYVTYEPALDAEGNIIGVSYSGTDVSDMARQEETISRQEESFREIERILSAEIKQPLILARNGMNRLQLQKGAREVEEVVLLEAAFVELEQKRTIIADTKH
ncbi:GAF domain-containing protein [Mucilaginibacter sp. Bleaf8]|uniref:GAF domain-containing protein n=1 Tax=Mucilaginibacter sp. Bleaf8 TaxID=2834430 RepID=UPI001BD0C540|nr:GAF domain-containing protein [Mucilaginibacter sp. Bleaf8]MBS7562999.1 GAF domain-containing protein [Mucilaginibacter sp. Bleaf8]